MRKENRTKYWIWASAVLWMAVIFWFSAQTGGESSKLSDAVASAVQGGIPASESLRYWLRKSAHFFEYLILGGLFFTAFSVTFTIKPRVAALCAAAAGVLYAAMDEGHQAFVPGRSAKLSDVMLDGAGVLCGVLLALGALLIWRRCQKPRQRP